MIARVLRPSCVVAALLLSACGPFRAEVPEFREGIEHFDAGRYPEAETRFDAALEAEPSPEAHFGKGASLYRQGRFEDATEQFRRSTGAQLDPLKARGYLNLGNTRASAGDLDGAIDAYRRTLEVDPIDHDARYNLEWALRAKEGKQQGEGDEKQDQGEDSGEGGEKDEQGDGREEQQDRGDEEQQGADGDEEEQDDGAPRDGDGEDDGDQGDSRQQAEQEGPEDGQSQSDRPGDSREEQGSDEKQADGAPGQQADPEPRERPARALSRQEAAEVLDAIQASEQPLQPWKFEVREKRERGAVEKDW